MYASGPLDMLWTMMFEMDCGGHRARETAFADPASNNKYFPLRAGLQPTTSRPRANTADGAILQPSASIDTRRCLLRVWTAVLGDWFARRSKECSLPSNSKVSTFSLTPSLFSNDYMLYTCMAFLRTLTGASMVKQQQTSDNNPSNPSHHTSF